MPRSCISTHLLIINAHWIAALCRSDNSSTVLNRPVCGHMAGRAVEGSDRARCLSMSSGWEFPQSVDSIVETNTYRLTLPDFLRGTSIKHSSAAVGRRGSRIIWLYLKLDTQFRPRYLGDGRDIIRGHQSSIYKINPILFRILYCYPLIGCSIF